MKDVTSKPVFNRHEAESSIGFALHWQRAIGSNGCMDQALEELQDLVGALSVMHIRHNTNSLRPKSAARHEPTSGKLFSRPPRSFASVVLRDNLYTARVGTVWVMSDECAEIETRDRLSEFNIGDLAVVPLENTDKHSDFLEFQFGERMLRHNRMLLETLGPLMADAWSFRTPGTISAIMIGRPSRVAREKSAAEAARILDIENPAGLTRSEFHVCVLIQEGKLAEEIVQTLNVKKSTLRSHMRSIYLKTGVSGPIELVHRLHGVVASSSASA